MIPSWLEEVIRAPEDEYVRLVAADVIERDDPVRAAFVRDQVATERALAAVTESSRVAGVLAAEPPPTAAWFAELVPPYPISGRGFGRGFIEHVQVDTRMLLGGPDWLFARAPIRFLTLTDLGDLAPAVAASPWLVRIRALRVPRHTMLTPTALIEDRIVAPRTHPAYEANALDDAALAALCDSPYLANLGLLDLTGHAAISIDTWVRLARAAPRLRWVAGAPPRGRTETLEAGYELSRWFEPDPVAQEIEARHGAPVPWLGSTERLGWWQRMRAICAGAQLVEEHE